MISVMCHVTPLVVRSRSQTLGVLIVIPVTMILLEHVFHVMLPVLLHARLGQQTAVEDCVRQAGGTMEEIAKRVTYPVMDALGERMRTVIPVLEDTTSLV